MTDVTTGRDQEPPELPAADEQLLRELTERARSGGLKLTGEGGLLGRLTKMVVEGALEGELDDHLGYRKNDPAGRDGGNSRNGHRAKTVLTDTGPVEISVPRDPDASFEPKIVAKRQRRLTGVDNMVISLSAKGLTHGEIAAHLAEVYGAEVSKQTITTITNRVMEGLADWQNRPLNPVYAVLFIDAINVKIREGQVANRPDLPGAGRHGGRGAGRAGPVGRGARRRRGRQVLAAGPDRDQEPRGRRCVPARSATGSKGCPMRSARCGKRPLCKPASFICCGTRSSTRRKKTGRRSRKSSGPSTPRHRKVRRWTGSPSSPASGRNATRRSSGCGRRVGRIRAVPAVRPGNTHRHLHHQCDRIDQRPAAARRQRPRPLPHRAGRPQMPLPGTDEPGPHQARAANAGPTDGKPPSTPSTSPSTDGSQQAGSNPNQDQVTPLS